MTSTYGWTARPQASIPRIFRDGSSNTITYLERYQMCNTGARGFAHQGAHNDVNAAQWPVVAYDSVNWGMQYPDPNFAYTADQTGMQYDPATNSGLYKISPNAPTYPGAYGALPQWQPTDTQCKPQMVQSHSTAGIQVALGDGTVRTVSPTVSATTWGNALRPNDGFTLGSDW